MRKFNLGFTLIEILVATAVVIASTTVVVAILSSSFRGISKATVSEQVRQNGNSAISRMSRAIQFADGFQGASTDGVSFNPCTSVSSSYSSIKIASDGKSQTFSCQNLSLTDSAGTSSLVDQTIVNIDSCSITCVQSGPSTPPVIGIDFVLSQVEELGAEQDVKIPFSTSVKMRNL